MVDAINKDDILKQMAESHLGDGAEAAMVADGGLDDEPGTEIPPQETRKETVEEVLDTKEEKTEDLSLEDLTGDIPEEKDTGNQDAGNFSLEDLYESAAKSEGISIDDIKKVVQDTIAPYLEEDEQPNTKAQDTDDKPLTRKELMEIRRAEKAEQANEAACNDIIGSYEDALYSRLEKAGFDVSPGSVTDIAINSRFSQMLNNAEAKTKGRITPSIVKRLTQQHAKEVEKMLGKARPAKGFQKVETKPSTMDGAAPTTQARQNFTNKKPVNPNNNIKAFNDKVNEIVKKKGDLTPSQGSAYARKMMNLSGATEIKF